MKGNLYFKKDAVEEEEKDNLVEEGVAGLSDNGEAGQGVVDEDDAFEKMKNQTSRYFTENNPTIKCRRCL